MLHPDLEAMIRRIRSHGATDWLQWQLSAVQIRDCSCPRATSVSRSVCISVPVENALLFIS